MNKKVDKTGPTIGDGFPADDGVAQWVVALSMAMNDFATLDTRIHEALDADSPDSRYLIRILCGALREFWRLVDVAQDPHHQVAEFVRELPTESRESLDRLNALFVRPDPGEEGLPTKSWAEEYLLDIRNRTFHYPRPGAQELRVAMKDSAQAPLVIHESNSSRPFEFADLVSLHMAFGDVDQEQERERFKQILIKVKEIQNLTISLVFGAIGQQLRRRGIDPLSVAASPKK